MDVHTTDGGMDRLMDRHMNGQCENIIPHHMLWWGIKGGKNIKQEGHDGPGLLT